MLRFIDNLYYRFYKLTAALGEDIIPRYNAVLLLSFFSFFNFLTAIALIMIATRRIVIVDSKGNLLTICLLIIAINSWRVFGKRRYQIIEDRFELEDKKSKRINNLVAAAYVVLTIAF